MVWSCLSVRIKIKLSNINIFLSFLCGGAVVLLLSVLSVMGRKSQEQRIVVHDTICCHKSLTQKHPPSTASNKAEQHISVQPLSVCFSKFSGIRHPPLTVTFIHPAGLAWLTPTGERRRSPLSGKLKKTKKKKPPQNGCLAVGAAAGDGVCGLGVGFDDISDDGGGRR